jgi:alkanesulfonate monooxygenase SsuD/methylene tetrahydromethanopterin reductase-like flavin-dependent oxidoreductase (luciferase family)
VAVRPSIIRETNPKRGVVRIFSFHLMPWPHLPEDFEQTYDSAWIWFPNSFFDPEEGHHLYNRYLDELELAEPLGFDGVCVNEHHQNAYGLMPSPNLFAATLARRTKRIKIAVVGNALPLYDPPTRVAEEYAIIDVISGGRLIAGMVVGGGPEYYSFSINPTQARERFREALDLIVAAWTREGPFEWNGKHYKIRYVNTVPRPYQKPHPPIWIPGVGSIETMELVVERGYAYMGIPYFHISVFQRNYDMFREIAEKAGKPATPDQLGWLTPIYVAETDERARAEFEPHLWYFARKLLKGINIAPPGYTSARSFQKIIEAMPSFLLHQETWDQVEEGAYAIVGSPATVRDKLIDHLGKLGAGNLLGLFQLGTLPHDLTIKSMTMFARQVMPALRDHFG